MFLGSKGQSQHSLVHEHKHCIHGLAISGTMYLGIVFDGLLNGIVVRHIGKGGLNVEIGSDEPEVAVGASVDIIHADNVLATLEEVGYDRLSR